MMNRERVMMLLDFLEGKGQFEGKGVPAEKFHLGTWHSSTAVSYPHMEKSHLNALQMDELEKSKDRSLLRSVWNILGELKNTNYKKVAPLKCHTVGCAIGWAASEPAFMDLGLCLVAGPEASQAGIALVEDDQAVYYEEVAIRHFFNFDNMVTGLILFYPSRYATGKRTQLSDVIARIKYLLENGEEKLRFNYHTINRTT